MENCITRNERAIKSEYELNGKKIEIEQRLLTDSEVDQYQKNHIDITQDPDVFKALLANERANEANDLDEDTLFRIRTATKQINDAKKELDYWFLSKSMSENVFYGGYMIIDGKEIDNKDLITYIKLLDPSIISDLLKKANDLSFPTEVEVTEAK